MPKVHPSPGSAKPQARKKITGQPGKPECAVLGGNAVPVGAFQPLTGNQTLPGITDPHGRPLRVYTACNEAGDGLSSFNLSYVGNGDAANRTLTDIQGLTKTCGGSAVRPGEPQKRSRAAVRGRDFARDTRAVSWAWEPEPHPEPQPEPVIPGNPIQIFARYNQFGRGFVGKKHLGGNVQNLKRGGRERLNRNNLTAHARRMIQGAGDYFEHKVQNNLGEAGQSCVMITLTYGRNVPDHDTAKAQLELFIKRMKREGAKAGKNFFSMYAWVAQLQTGERAVKAGKESYRAKHGAAIHFHILTERVPIEAARKHWCGIVNAWERKNEMKETKLGGVDIRSVFNASHYISRYISNETKSGNILGSLWGVSNEMRRRIGIKDGEPINTTDKEWKAFVRAFKIASREHDVRDAERGHSVRMMNDWEDNPIVFARDVGSILRAFTKWKRNRVKVINRQCEKAINIQCEKKQERAEVGWMSPEFIRATFSASRSAAEALR